MDLFGPTIVARLGGMHYAYMCWLMITLDTLDYIYLLIRMKFLKPLKVFHLCFFFFPLKEIIFASVFVSMKFFF